MTHLMSRSSYFVPMLGIVTIFSVAGCASQNPAAKQPTIDGKKAQFVTETQILLVRKGPANAANKPAEDDYFPTQALVLQSEVILQQAAERLKKTAFDKIDAETLHARLRVRREPENTNILRLTWYGNDEKEGPVVLRSIVDVYKEFLDVKLLSTELRVRELLVQAREAGLKELRTAEARQIEFIKSHSSILNPRESASRAAVLAEKLEVDPQNWTVD